MKVFISWSGERSKQVGELLKFWVKCVIQELEPWISTEMDRGTVWFSTIGEELNQSMNAIVCLTKENLNKPWILFEAGALTRGLSSNRVCTFLVDVKPEDVEDPLGQLNHTSPTKEDLFKLIRTLNNRLLDKALPDELLKNAFETYWPQFEEKFETIISSTKEAVLPPKEETDILADIYKSVRQLNNRMFRMERDIYNRPSPSNSNFLINRKINNQKDESNLVSIRVAEDILAMVNKGRLDLEEVPMTVERYNLSELEKDKVFELIQLPE